MTSADHDPIVEALEALRIDAPPGLSSKVFAGWMAAPSRIGEVYVAFTDGRIQYVRTAESVDGDAEKFREAYRTRFARPLRPAGRPPRGLLPTLRRGSGTPPALDLGGLSGFERSVLDATRRIPVGETRPYGWIARETGRPGAVRAAGSVLARNPVPLLIPCHRVVRADGTHGDYIFGASHKEALLRAEHVNIDEVRALAGQGVRFLGSDTTNVVCFPTCHTTPAGSPPPTATASPGSPPPSKRATDPASTAARQHRTSRDSTHERQPGVEGTTDPGDRHRRPGGEPRATRDEIGPADPMINGTGLPRRRRGRVLSRRWW